jgi:hypothetical protein
MLFSALIIPCINPKLLSCECKKTELEFVKIGKRWNMNCFSAHRTFKDRQDKRTLVHGPFIALKRLQNNGVVQPVGRTNLKRRKDIILIKQKNLKRVIADRTRESFKSWLAALARAKKLRLRGYEVKLPPPHLGCPQLLLIITPKRKAWDRDNALPSGRQSHESFCRYNHSLLHRPDYSRSIASLL